MPGQVQYQDSYSAGTRTSGPGAGDVESSEQGIRVLEIVKDHDGSGVLERVKNDGGPGVLEIGIGIMMALEFLK